MADATSANVAAIPGDVDMVAGYVTGTPDVQWTPSDWALFPGKQLVTIDQGAAGSPVSSAVVRDVETGAWTPAGAVSVQPWTAARPTIYCNQSTLPVVLSTGWRGDLWLAVIGWQPGMALPDTRGCPVVAVQNQQNVAGTYDLSVVLDDTWPGGDVNGTGSIIVWGPENAYLLNGGRTHHITDNNEMAIYVNAQVPGAAATSPRMTAAQETAFLADYPPGNPSVTVNTTAPTFNITGTAVPAS